MVPSSNFDPGVMLRALRFRANLAGYRIERGHYMDRPADRSVRCYLVPAADENAPRSGDGYPTLVRVREELDNLPNLRERSSPDE